MGPASDYSAEQQGQFADLYQKLGIIPTWTDNTVSIPTGVAALVTASTRICAKPGDEISPKLSEPANCALSGLYRANVAARLPWPRCKSYYQLLSTKG